MNIIRAAAKHWDRVALLSKGTEYKYKDLLTSAQALSERLQGAVKGLGGNDLGGPRIGVLYSPGQEYVVATWAAWMIGGIAVPLSESFTAPELGHVIRDSQMSVVLSSDPLRNRAQDGLQGSEAKMYVPNIDRIEGQAQMSVPNSDDNFSESGALLIYTSGTTGKPKGALHTHGGLLAQISGMTDAWGWNPNDRILHGLPLHHIHGIVNALYTPHYNGACVDMLSRFSPQQVWDKFKDGSVSVFMGVPTMYSHLLSALHRMPTVEQEACRRAASKMRLFVCGSSACPASIFKCWEEATGHVLLERYGMTEIGMALSNPLKGERRPGTVGTPLPGVHVIPSKTQQSSQPCELLVKGKSVFKGYWNNPKATAAAFDEDGWFKTGDTVIVDGEPPYYQILGRTSVDIIKSGGHKLSALEIESSVLENPEVQECAVIGVPDDVYGERVIAVAAMKNIHQSGGEQQIIDFCTDRLARYKVPRQVWLVDSIPRNAMGKVNKLELVKAFLAKSEASKTDINF